MDDTYAKPKLVQTEKLRADRTKAPLSIALFHFNANQHGELNNINKLFDLLRNSTRETDIVGYVSDDLIGLILPDTNEERLQKFMKKIVSGYADLPFSVITGTYPDQIFDRFVMENRESPDFYPLFLEDSRKPKQLDSSSPVWSSWIALKRIISPNDNRQSGPHAERHRLNDIPRSPSVAPLPKFYFLKQLQRERRRTDRTKVPLSVVLFRFDATLRGKANSIHHLLELLHGSIRETDLVGYLDEDLIGVLLSDTNQEGAQRFVSKIVKGYKNPPFSTLIGIYPDQIFDNLLMETDEREDIHHFFLEDSIKPKPLSYSLKRFLDITGSLVGLVLFSPLMLLTALAIKFTSPGPIIFKQIRLGQRGVPFVFYKFRSMLTNTDDRIHREYVTHLIKGNLKEINQGDQETPLYKIKEDPRVTRVGRIIRKTSIDELPQLFNVLKGDMSLVGPRPPLPYEVEKYQSWHLRRILDAKPGITGLWQVEGRSQTSFDDMVRLDLQYIRNWSPWLDFKILLKTVKVVLKSAGAF